MPARFGPFETELVSGYAMKSSVTVLGVEGEKRQRLLAFL